MESLTSLSSIMPGGFNAADIDPAVPPPSAPLPPGIYSVELTNAELRSLKDGKGTGLNLEFTVIDPEQYERRRVWQMLCIVHKTSEQAEQIAKSQLSALCRAVNIAVLEDVGELFGRVLKIRTRVAPAKGDYPAKAEVVEYISASVPMPTQASKPTAPATTSRNEYAAAKAGVPWGKK